MSVTIPTVAFDMFCEQAVRSALDQAGDAVEVLVILDNALSGPIPDWIDSAPQVGCVVLGERRGTPFALNVGLAEARGEYVARLDADDIAQAGRFDIQATFLDVNPSVVCVGTAVTLIDAGGEVLGALQTARATTDLRAALLRSNCFVHSSVMYRREVVRAAGGYNLAMDRMQDYELFLRLATVGDLAYIPSALTSYRIHPSQHSRKSSPWAGYTRMLLRRRRELAASMGRSDLLQRGRNVLWWSAQVMRHYGIRQPGYLKGVGSGAR